MGILTGKTISQHMSEGLPRLQGTLRITELLGIVPTAALPLSKDTVMGVINFRGKTVPVLDLRFHTLKGFGDYSEQICIYSAKADHETDPVIFGALVDSEEDAYELVSGSTH